MITKITRWLWHKTVHYQDISQILTEVSPKFALSRAQMESWYKVYHEKKDPLLHPYVEIARLMTNAGLHEDASCFYLRFLETSPDKQVHSLYLQNLLLSQSATNASLFTAHQAWAKRYGHAQTQTHWPESKRQKDKKIKIGYICHFFDNSISQNVLLPLLKRHDHTQFEIYCYDDGNADPSYHQYATKWQDIRNFSDETLAKLLKHDDLDIIQELNGFCVITRFGALAYRPAPIQINWYNHTSTTGLPFIDYVMSDVVSIQESDLNFFSEKAYRHQDFIAAVHFAPEKFGEINATPPVAEKGFITFGYFGGSHKITLTTIQAWSQILKRCPYARLHLKCAAFTHEEYRTIFRQHFLKAGIDETRLTLEGWSSQADTLRRYNQIDIMLDNIPVSGGSTFFEALMQGVPTITLCGDRWAARSGAAVLTTLKHTELITYSIDEYVEAAVKLTQNPVLLEHYRRNLRTEMLQSSLTNMEQFCRRFEAAYKHMWHAWCDERAPA